MAESLTDDSAIESAVRQFRRLTTVGIALGGAAIVAGIVTLGVAGQNPGFPVFNFGPILIGLVMVVACGIGIWTVQKALHSSAIKERVGPVKCAVIGVWTISFIDFTFAIVSGIFSLLAGLQCAGTDMTWHRKVGDTQEKLNTEQYCHPNVRGNIAMAFIDVVLCILVGIWCIFAVIYFIMHFKLYFYDSGKD